MTPNAFLRRTRAFLVSAGAMLLRCLLAAYCASPMTASVRAQTVDSSTVRFQLPLERATHSFTIRQPAPDGSLANRPVAVDGIANLALDPEGNQVPSASSYLRGSGPVAPSDYYLRDESTGETTPPNLFGTPSFDRTSFLTTPWYSRGEASTAFFFTLPAERFNDVLSLVAAGVTYPISNGSQLEYESTDAQGQPVVADYGFFEGSVSTAPWGHGSC